MRLTLPSRWTTLVVLLLLVVALPAATKKHGNPDPLPFSKNDEMVRPDGTDQAWKDQADQVTPLPDAPYVTGFMMWRGRSDRQYKPFHQWEVRIHAGEADREDLRLRLDALGPDLKPILGHEGHVVDLKSLGKGKQVDLSYKLNTSAPSAARLTLWWDGGEEVYLSPDGKSIPVPQGGLDDQANLLVLQPFFEYKKKQKAALVKFYLRNEGGKDAEEVVHTISFKDAEGKVVHTHGYIPEKGTIKAGYAKEQEVLVKQCPPFSTIGISTAKKEQGAGPGGLVLDPGAFTKSATIEVAEVAVTDGQLQAKVRNGTKDAIAGLQVDLQLFDDQGQVLVEVALPAGDIPAGEIVPVAAPLEPVSGVAGWGFAYSTGVPTPAAQPAPEREGPIASMTVEGVQFDVLDTRSAADLIKVKARFTNTTGADLAGLVCTVTVRDGSGGEGNAAVQVGDLADQATYEGSFVVEGVSGIDQVGLSYTTE